MPVTNDRMTLVCLFHHRGQADAAVKDLRDAGVPESSVSVIGGGASTDSGSETLNVLGLPERDFRHLSDGINDGGIVVAVAALAEHIGAVEGVFGKHHATQIDDTDTPNQRSDQQPNQRPEAVAPPAAAATGERVIPVVEEQLQVGKRTVDRGGVRVYRRVVDLPADQSINLREEHVVVERNPVNRPATQNDLDGQGNRTIELTETAEEAVISKSARVIEEVIVGKQTDEHTEHISETVRRTEVEVEQLPVMDTNRSSKRSI